MFDSENMRESIQQTYIPKVIPSNPNGIKITFEDDTTKKKSKLAELLSFKVIKVRKKKIN